MKSRPRFHVKKRTLLAIAGVVWIIAGTNVAKLGISAYLSIDNVSIINILLSIGVFCVFGAMFHKISVKHLKRIQLYEGETQLFLNFFDLKSYLIMVFMISGGIWLRASGLVPLKFIAVFYTGLGFALTLAGLFFVYMYFKYLEPKKT